MLYWFILCSDKSGAEVDPEEEVLRLSKLVHKLESQNLSLSIRLDTLEERIKAVGDYMCQCLERDVTVESQFQMDRSQNIAKFRATLNATLNKS